MIQKRIFKILSVILLIFICGVTGYIIIEKWTFLDSLYMTVITLTTVGFMEVQPLSPAGRLFTVIILITGFSVILYGFGVVTAFFVEGELMGILRRRRMKKEISRLNQHYIICGAGNMGRYVIDEFIKTENPFVVVEKDVDEVQLLQERFKNILYVEGDASSDAALKNAGIEKASGVITTFSSDKDNLFVVLTARSINSDLRIVARCIEDESRRKLQTAGANAIVSANSIGGMRIASEMLRPTVVSFLDVMLRGKDEALRVEEALIKQGSKIDNLIIEEAGILKNIGLIIIAVKDGKTGQYIYNPCSDFRLKSGDTLIVIGRVEQIRKLRECTGN